MVQGRRWTQPRTTLLLLFLLLARYRAILIAANMHRRRNNNVPVDYDVIVVLHVAVSVYVTVVVVLRHHEQRLTSSQILIGHVGRGRSLLQNAVIIVAATASCGGGRVGGWWPKDLNAVVDVEGDAEVAVSSRPLLLTTVHQIWNMISLKSIY